VSPDGRSDAALIAESLRRPEAFAEVFERHFGAVHAYLARRAGVQVADDLASVTFTVAFERRGGFRAQTDSARPWLFGIATNVLRNERRAERRARGRLVSFDSVAQAPGDAEGRGELDGVLSALRELDDAQRDVLVLYAWEGLSYEEIACALAIPVGTVRSRLSRARRRLKARLEEREEPAGERLEVGE
jgi:RNA polymerase sigma-70 factor (ECF subfamily)